MTQEKRRYKIKNWRAYNEALVNRGSLTLWFEGSQIERWHQPERSGLSRQPDALFRGGDPVQFDDQGNLPVDIADDRGIPEVVGQFVGYSITGA